MSAIIGNSVRLWQPCLVQGNVVESDASFVLKDCTATTTYTAKEPTAALLIPTQRYPRGLHVLPPNSDRYLTGLLAETESHGTVLGLSTYISGGHRGIAHAIEQAAGPVQAYQWGGELLLENTSDAEAAGQLLSTINTSGYLNKLAQEPGTIEVGNLNKALIAAATRLSPFTFVQSDIAVREFHQAAQHLCSDFDELGVANINARHDLGLLLHSLALFLSFEIQKKPLKPESRSGLIEDIKVLRAFCYLMQKTTPLTNIRLDDLIRYFDAFIQDTPLSHAELVDCMDAYQELRVYWNENITGNKGNEYDLFLLNT